ncbi:MULTISPECIES: hypothetical protein [unclassified Streptomyces]|uniref:hypothetical protein n=1 Tax=unclassified Streptomyces TaxID=2593676 RepID=UPI003662A65C
MSDDRILLIAGLRALACWLETTPQAPSPGNQRMLLPLHVNSAVEAFAAEHGLTVTHDDEGNASADMRFGPLSYHVYGYRDFDEHCENADARTARRWAARNGLRITEATGGPA